MTDQISNDLENPDDARAPDGQRRDGRPSTGSIDDRRPGSADQPAPTEAPEETGGSPTTEHAPGGDL